MNRGIKIEKQPSVIDRAVQKMWRNSQKAIKEHRDKAPGEPYVTLEEIPSIPAFKRSFERQEVLTLQGEISENQGNRRSMQDVHFGVEIEEGLLSGVLDGHGSLGDQVASYASCKFPEKFSKALKEANHNVHQAFQMAIDIIHSEVIMKEKWRKSGTTAVICFIDKRTHLIYTATLGDSEANIYRKIKGVFKSIPLSCVRDWNSEKDAKRVNLKWPTNANKKRRYPRPRDGVNISRSIGDQKYMQTEEYPGVIHKAKITVNKLFDGDFLILGCDGLKDFVTETEVIAQLNGNDKLAKRLVDYAIDIKNATDNVTVLAVEVLSFKSSCA